MILHIFWGWKLKYLLRLSYLLKKEEQDTLMVSRKLADRLIDEKGHTDLEVTIHCLKDREQTLLKDTDTESEWNNNKRIEIQLIFNCLCFEFGKKICFIMISDKFVSITDAECNTYHYGLSFNRPTLGLHCPKDYSG